MKTFKKNTTIYMLLDIAKRHVELAEIDLDYLDMANEELNVAIRLSEEKKGYTIVDVINEMYDYINFKVLWENPKTANYIEKVSKFKFELKKKDYNININ